MELVKRTNRPAAWPLALLIAVLTAIVLGGMAISARHQPAPASLNASATTSIATSLSPDAQERNAAILDARVSRAEATHGH